MRDIWKKVQCSPFVSITLVTINCILFILCLIFGERLYTLGYLGLRGILFDKEYGRFIWSMFLHADLEHLFNNMILLIFLGSMLEKAVGHMPYAILYFLSGIGGGALSLLVKIMNNDWSLSLGASGAIFGLDGLLLAVVLLLHDRVQDITPVRVGLMIILSLYSGFRSPTIDNAAHIGGLLTGLLAGLLICGWKRMRKKKRSYGSMI